jgi:hypothetical protein
VIYLASAECEVTHEIFSVGAGRVARAFVGVTPGWIAGSDATFKPEEVADNLDIVRDTGEFLIPGSVMEETMSARQRTSA